MVKRFAVHEQRVRTVNAGLDKNINGYVEVGMSREKTNKLYANCNCSHACAICADEFVWARSEYLAHAQGTLAPEARPRRAPSA